MTDRTLKRLVVVLVSAVVVWVAVTLASDNGDGPVAATGEITQFFEGLDEATVTGVRFTGREGSIELSLAEGAWLVNGHTPDTLMVSRLLGTLAEASAGDLAGTNPANHDRMGVSVDSAVTLEIDAAGETRTLLLGKAGTRSARVHARLPGQDEVYLLEADLGAPARRREEDWRNKRVVATDTSRVARIEVERDGEAYTLVRGEDGWAFEDGGEVQDGTVRSILSELAGLVASGFLAESDSVAMLERGGSTVAYFDTGEIVAQVTIGTGENDRWARVPREESIYRLPAFRIDRLTPKLESVQPAP